MNQVIKVKELCKQNEMPIAVLERKCGFSNGYFSKLTKGKIPHDKLLVIASIFAVPVTVFYDIKDNMPDLLSNDEKILIEFFRNEPNTGAIHMYLKGLCLMQTEGNDAEVQKEK